MRWQFVLVGLTAPPEDLRMPARVELWNWMPLSEQASLKLTTARDTTELVVGVSELRLGIGDFHSRKYVLHQLGENDQQLWRHKFNYANALMVKPIAAKILDVSLNEDQSVTQEVATIGFRATTLAGTEYSFEVDKDASIDELWKQAIDCVPNLTAPERARSKVVAHGKTLRRWGYVRNIFLKPKK